MAGTLKPTNCDTGILYLLSCACAPVGTELYPDTASQRHRALPARHMDMLVRRLGRLARNVTLRYASCAKSLRLLCVATFTTGTCHL